MEVVTQPPLENTGDPLQSVDQKNALLCDRVRSVVQGEETGLLVYGRGGTGKSYQIFGELARNERRYLRYNGKLTPRGFFNALVDHPDKVLVFEDVERLFRNPDAAAILRSALWGNPADTPDSTGGRVVTWSTKHGSETTTVTGGIILVANTDLPSTPEFEAVKSRMCVFAYDLDDDEMAAHMRRIASVGYVRGEHRLDSEECGEVCDYLLNACRVRSKRPNLRLLELAFQDKVSHSADRTDNDWKTLVESRVAEGPVATTRPMQRRAERKEIELRLVAELQSVAQPQERVRRWCDETKKSQSSYYRRLEEVQRTLAVTAETLVSAAEVPAAE